MKKLLINRCTLVTHFACFLVRFLQPKQPDGSSESSISLKQLRPELDFGLGQYICSSLMVFGVLFGLCLSETKTVSAKIQQYYEL